MASLLSKVWRPRREKPSKPAMPDSPHTEGIRVLLDTYLDEIESTSPDRWSIKVGDYAAGREILDSEPLVQAVAFRVATVVYADSLPRGLSLNLRRITSYYAVKALITQLLRRSLPITEDDLKQLLEVMLHQADLSEAPLAAFVGACERSCAEIGPGEGLAAALGTLRDRLASDEESAVRKLAKRIDALISEPDSLQLLPDDPWAERVLAAIAAMDEPEQRRWRALVNHAATATSARPSRMWLDSARPLCAALADSAPADTLRRWFAWFITPARPEQETPAAREEWYVDPRLILPDSSADALKGLVWCCAVLADEAMPRALGDLAAACFKKVRYHGPRNSKVGNACLVTLVALPGEEPVAQLSRLRSSVKQPSAVKQIDKALARMAEQTGLGVDDLEEMAVPSFGMQSPGELHRPIGELTAVIRVDGSTATLSWQRADGKSQATTPAAVKREHADELKELQGILKEIRSQLPAQRDRIERGYLQQRDWDLATWRTRYLDHPFSATLARRLIWRFCSPEHDEPGAWNDGRIVDSGDNALEWLEDDTRVSLWHPIGSPVETVQAWRDWLARHDIRQPFKQAHREIYLLTDAERDTGIYSNRFAANILKQHQFTQLCQQRGWRYQLMGGWDSHNVPSLSLPQHNLEVELWVEAMPGSETSEMGIFVTVSTDQVRFLGPDHAPLPLNSIPTLVFSEVLRDVDLFVSVCSIGNDPNWRDGGYYDYWQSYSFGELTETAVTRRQVLERLVPRLKIADRCTITERFLEVRGELATYKIHLGSSHVLAEPGSRYLCIVAGRGKGAGRSPQLVLPFEGDEMLSIILSKAFLLAADTNITDSTIRSQLQ